MNLLVTQIIILLRISNNSYIYNKKDDSDINKLRSMSYIKQNEGKFIVTDEGSIIVNKILLSTTTD